MPSEKVIHHLETGVPLIVDEHQDLSTSKSQSDIKASSFDSVVFMYGMYAGVIVQFATFGFLQLITNLVAHGDAASMAKILEDKMMYWIHAIVGFTFTTATYFLCTKLFRFGFDRNTRSLSGQKDKEEEEREDKECHIVILALELTFALGNLTVGCLLILLCDWLFGTPAALFIHAAVLSLFVLVVFLFLRNYEVIDDDKYLRSDFGRN